MKTHNIYRKINLLLIHNDYDKLNIIYFKHNYDSIFIYIILLYDIKNKYQL